MNTTILQPPTLEIDAQLFRGEPMSHRSRMYRRVVFNLLEHLQQAGFSIMGIHDGEDFTRAKTSKEAMELIFNLDESYIMVRRDNKTGRHSITIVLGNDEPEDIIADWTFTDGDPDKFSATMDAFDAEEYA